MTPSEALQRECQDVMWRTGRYIPPYRMALLMQTAQKVTNMINKADICTTYEECSLVLDIVSGAIKSVTGHRETN